MKMIFSKKLLPSALLLAGFFVFGSSSAHAAFDAGRIIDDSVFTNKSAMSVGEIQNFLNSKVPVCDTNHAPGSGSQGEQPPWVCLKDFSENGKSAAQIIWEAGQTYNINPQVILVTLQKENGLITDTWPYDWQYRTAMGMGCPDGAACDSQYYGFTNQVNQGTRHLAGFYNQNPGWYIPYRPGLSYVKWHPNAACGGSNVNIVNRATASLYSYTPYQPNAAALANMYGTGDGCSSYGNRNFWRDFTSWFGTTYTPTYGWQLVGQYAYTDQTMTVGKSTTGMFPGDMVYVGFKAKNMGSTTWTNNGSIKVGTIAPTDRNSPFCNAWANGCNRPAMLKEASVAPGEIGTFEFWMKAPNNPGVYFERFSLVAEGVGWMNDQGLGFYMTVDQPRYTWQLQDQYAYTDQNKTTGKGTTNLLPGDRVYIGFKAKNTGNMTWKKTGPGTVNVGMTRPLDRASPFYESSWLGTNRPTRMIESSVPPGGIGTFEFWMKAPIIPGTYYEYFSLVAEGIAWMNDPGMNFYSTVNQAKYSWQFMGQYAYTDQNKTTGKSTVGLAPGERVYVGFKAKNTGNTTWRNTNPGSINVGMTRPLDRASPFYESSWLGTNRPTRMIESSVPPGGIGTFEFWMKAPIIPGTYYEYFSLVAEGIAWMNDPGMNFYSTVHP